MREIIDALEAMFKEKGAGRTEMPPKPGIHSRPDAFIHAMPAYIPGLRAAGMKWVSGYPENQRRGLPYITGLLMLNDPERACPWLSWTAPGSRPSVRGRPRRWRRSTWRVRIVRPSGSGLRSARAQQSGGAQPASSGSRRSRLRSLPRNSRAVCDGNE